MKRIVLMVLVTSALLGCEAKQSSHEEISLRREENRAQAAEAQERLIKQTAEGASAVPLMPVDTRWKYRFQAQDHFANLQKKNVIVKMQVEDIVRHPEGLVVSGQLDVQPTSAVLIWVRLHKVPDAIVRKMEMYDDLLCLGQPTVTSPAGSHFKIRALSEGELELSLIHI